jgi:hypothetical protein
MTTAAPPVDCADVLPANPTLDALREELDATAATWNAVSAEIDTWRKESATVDSDLREATTARARREVFARRRELRLRAAELPDEAAIVAEHYVVALEAWAREAHRFGAQIHNKAVIEAQPLRRERSRLGELLSPSRPTGLRDEATEDKARATSAELAKQLRPILARLNAGRELAGEARRVLTDRFGDDIGRESGTTLIVPPQRRREWLEGVRRSTRAKLNA